MVLIIAILSLGLFLAGGILLVRSRRRPAGHQPNNAAKWSRQDRLAALSMASGIVLGVVSAVQPFAMDAVTEDAPELQVAGLAVLDHNEKEPGPALDLKLRNVGSQVSVLTRLTLVVEDVGRLKICEAGGPLMSSFTYRVQLPANAKKKQLISTPLSQEIAPNTADRFQTRIGLSGHDPEDGGYYVYLLRVQLFHDADPNPVDAGKVVVVVPANKEGAVLDDYRYYMDEDESVDDPLGSCYKSNRTLLERMSRADAVRPKKLTDTPL